MSFTPQNFVNQQGPAVSAAWLNGVDTTVNYVLGGATTVALAQAALGINYTYAGTGGVLRTLTSKLSDFVSVLDFGAVGNGVTDDTTALNAAFASGAPSVYLPPLNYYTATGVTIPAGVSVWSEGFQPTNPPSGCRITGALSCATVVTLGGGAAGNGAASIKGVSILRSNGTPPAGSIGLLVQNTYGSIVEDVFCRSHQIPLKLQNDGNVYGIACMLNRVYTGAAYDTHLLINSWPEARFNQCRFGMDGSGDQTANSYIRVIGGSATNTGDGPDTISFVNCQFNQGANTGTTWLSFQNQVASNLVPFNLFEFVNCYVEDDVTGITSDATVTQLDYLHFVNFTFIPTSTSRQFISLNAATELIDFKMANSRIGCAFTVTGAGQQIQALGLSNVTIVGAASFTGGNSSTANLDGLYCENGITLAGAWSGLRVSGQIQGGALTDTSTGTKLIDLLPQNALTSFVPGLTLGGAAVGMTGTFTAGYQQFGNLIIGQFDITLTALGSSTGAVAVVLTGLPALGSEVFNAGGGGMVNFATGMGALTAAPIMLSIGSGPALNLFQQTATGVNSVTNGNLTNTTHIRGTFQYFT